MEEKLKLSPRHIRDSAVAGRCDFAGKVNVEITGLPISSDGVTLTIASSN